MDEVQTVELLKQLVEEIKGLRSDMKTEMDRVGAAISGMNGLLQVQGEDMQFSSVTQLVDEAISVLDEANDLLDQNAQRLQWLVDRQAEAIEAATGVMKAEISGVDAGDEGSKVDVEVEGAEGATT